MTRPGTVAVAAVLATAVVISACAKPSYVIADPGPPAPQDWSSARLTPHVLLVSIDGLRPDAIDRFAAPTLQRLVREGSYTLKATTTMPSKTLPSHTSMLTGQPPERHGVLWNNVVTAEADLVAFPTVFGVARSHGYRTAAFFSKAKFQPLQQPGSLDYSQAPGGWFGRWSSDRTLRDVEQHLAGSRPNLMFVHFGDVDRAGHSAGWMSPAYGDAVRTVDSALGRLLRAAEQTFGAGNYTLLVTADHGGHEYDHGSDHPLDVTIPWIAWGRGVQAGPLAGTPIRTMDTASTVLWLLGVAEPADWIGSPVLGAFAPPAAASQQQQR
jgi:predicted AlkP superfamily pyrophosphatase or phosphodiesterase